MDFPYVLQDEGPGLQVFRGEEPALPVCGVGWGCDGGDSHEGTWAAGVVGGDAEGVWWAGLEGGEVDGLDGFEVE